MSTLISSVTARSWQGRMARAIIILLLTLGAATMVYPFVVMLSGSLRSAMDESHLDVVPKFLMDETAVYQKFLETKYNQSVVAQNRVHRRNYFNFASVPLTGSTISPELLHEWEAFAASDAILPHWQVLGGISAGRSVTENLRKLRQRIAERYDHDLDAFARETGNTLTSWGVLAFPPPDRASRRFGGQPGPVLSAFDAMQADAHPAERQLVSLSGLFLEKIIYPKYGAGQVDAYNAAHVSPLHEFDGDQQALLSYSDFRLPRTVPTDDETLRAEWIAFVLKEIHPSFVVVDADQTAAYQAHVRKQYGTPNALGDAWGEDAPMSFDTIALPAGEWLYGRQRQDYEAFLAQLPPEAYTLIGPEYAWIDHLRERYGDETAAARQLGVSRSDDVIDIGPLAATAEARFVADNRTSLRWTYATRNYVNVIDELVGEGRVLWNTAIYCAVSVALALLVNPAAAYALSRGRPSGTYRILMLLMVTMAFPPMVAMIPQFIVLREAGLLNTLVALVLPLMVNGYWIFMLKGFFDSLPQELYEAARIDGASELRMLFQITLALSRPILAVVALMTFTQAFAAFLYPLLVAPDKDQWLISVWLFQFQQRSSSAAIYAAVVVVSIPTLVMFLLAQRTIMRGVAVPSEK